MRSVTLWTILCGCAVFTSCCEGEEVQYNEFKDQPGIYLEEIGRALLTSDEWKLILFYDLNNYWKEWDHMKAVQAQLEQSCQKQLSIRKNNTAGWFSEVDHTCEPLIASIQFLMEGIEDRNALLRNPTRVRRAPLEFVGTFLNEAFGVLDQRVATRYEAQIKALQTGAIQMQDLIRQQTHVLDVTTNLVRKQQDQLMKQYRSVHVEIQELQRHAEFTDAALQIITHVTIFKEMQEAMIDVMTDLHQGHINTKLISPSQLRDQLRQLRTWIPADVQVPDYQQHWVKLYKTLGVKARLIGNHLIFELSIPLLGQEDAQVFIVHIVPTPHESRMVYIQPTSEILLVNLQRTWYYQMTAEELERCRAWEPNLIVCPQREALYLVDDSAKPCELRLLQHESQPLEHCQIQTTMSKTFVSPLRQTNRWIVSLAQPETFNVICNRTLTHTRVQRSGILTLTQGCTLKSKSFILKASSTYTSEKHVQFLPSFNLSKRITEDRNLVLNEDLNGDIQEMMTAVQTLHTREQWATDKVHNIYYYAPSGVTLILVVGALILAGLYWKRMRNHISQAWQNQAGPTPTFTHSSRRRTSA